MNPYLSNVGVRVGARSSSALAAETSGMPLILLMSRAGRLRVPLMTRGTDICRPFRSTDPRADLRLPQRTTSTPGLTFMNPQAAAALRPPSTAPSPAARTPAIQSPSCVPCGRPTAYTPGKTGKRKDRMRKSIVVPGIPAASSCRRATTPCCGRQIACATDSRSLDSGMPKGCSLPEHGWATSVTAAQRS